MVIKTLLSIEIILMIYMGGTALYLLFFAIASLFPIKQKKADHIETLRFVVLIPCYREDEVILEVARDALEQRYPADKFDVVIVADAFEEATIHALKKLPLQVMGVRFEVSTKTRATNYALRQLPEDTYDAVCILDADNIMESDFLHKMNQALNQGYVAVQGHRVAKNINTSFALLDAISEEINNQIFRKGQRVVGLSSALIGSAMAFRYTFFKQMMQEVEVVGGFDKELEIRLLRDGHAIDYVDNSYVFDEKVQNAKVFSRQRRRWLSAQIHYFGKSFLPATKAFVTKGNIEYFNKAIQYVQLPRILLIGLVSLFALSSLVLGIPTLTKWWLILWGVTIAALLLAIPRQFYIPETLKALFFLPVGFFFMFLSLVRIKGANKQFIHTKHTYNAFQIKRKLFFHQKP